MKKQWHKIEVNILTEQVDSLIGLFSVSFDIDGVEEKPDNDLAYSSVYFYIPILKNKDAITKKDITDLLGNNFKIKSLNVNIQNYDPANETEWKKYFKPSLVGKNIIIKPSWENFEPDNNQIIITIDPGTAFGTGLHGTTRGVIILLEELISDTNFILKNRNLLDIGTGSGILGIIAYKLGITDVTCVDNDLEAVITSKENIKINKIDSGINTFLCQLSKIENTYDIVLANIVSEVLINNKSKLINLLKPNGYLILSGILNKEADDLIEIFLETNNLVLIKKIILDDWTSLCLKLK